MQWGIIPRFHRAVCTKVRRQSLGLKSGKAQNERVFSGLPPKADLNPSSRHVAQVPEPAVSNRSRTASLLDHLVGAGEHRRRQLDAKSLSGFEVEHGF